ncbi:MAG: hypothetical protein IJM51_10345 [Clostridia bacterium]|nr:hypothetical protein [Clostridia bacterium]
MDELTRFTQFIRNIQMPEQRLLIAIDGRCAAGKTTLASRLQQEIGCNVFHMDDFFLRPEQRTEERLHTPGGNVDHERFLSEVLLPLKSGAEWIEFRAFDCSSMRLKPPVRVSAGEINVIEGSYCCHPALWKYYDLHVFMDVSADEQQRRIIDRNGADGWKVFSGRWIPLEEAYFQAYQIKERCEYGVSQKESGSIKDA